MTDDQLTTFLEKLTAADFARILSRMPDAGQFVPEGVPHLQRVFALLGYVRSSGGPGLDTLTRIVDDLLADQRRRDRHIQNYLEFFAVQMQSLAAETQFLSSKEKPDAVPLPLDVREFIIVPPSASEKLKPTTPTEPRIFRKFQDAFDEQGGRTLLLGIPGSGKTTTLFQFASAMAEAALADPAQPIPLFGSVHLWDHKTPLIQWVQEPIQKRLPEIDFANRSQLYIFDGLDELGGERPVDPEKPEGEKYDPRVQFLEAVAKQLPTAQVIISCRELDYEAIGKKAPLLGAVKLLPLTSEQIEAFLLTKNQPLLWDKLQADENLIELAQTPLLLYLLSGSAGTSGDVSALDTASLNTHTIFDFFISRMFAHESQKRKLPFTEEETRTLLGKLGAAMWDGWSLSTSLTMKTIRRVVRKQGLHFADFACSMHFLRSTANGYQFIHLKLRDFCTIPVFQEHLKAKSKSLRKRAASALGEIGDTSTVPALLEALKDTNGDVRGNIAVALGNIGDASAVPAIIEALKDSSEHIWEKSVNALAKIGEVAVPSLIEAYKDGNEDVRVMTVSALANIRNASAVPILIATLKDPNEDVRESVALALGNIRNASAVPALIEALEDTNEFVRGNVAEALARIGDKGSVPALVKALKDVHGYVQWRVAEALAKIGGAAVPALIEALTDPNEAVRWKAAVALSNIGDASAIPSLIEALKDTSELVRLTVKDALKKLRR